VVVSCFHDDDSTSTTFFDDGSGGVDTPPIVEDPPPISVTGTGLACDAVAPKSTVASTLKVEAPDSIPAKNISFDEPNESYNNHNAANNLKRLSAVVPGQTPTGSLYDDNGTPDDATDDFLIGDVHPLIVSYGEQVIGDYEGGDGSADIGDPDNIDDIFVSLSLDNGEKWKKMKVGDTAKSSSKDVAWSTDPYAPPTKYPGHSHKPTMQVQGNNILVAWNDKYCPSGDPFDLYDKDGNLNDPLQIDIYKVNGKQGTVDYGGIVAPNGKTLYEVPYSCVWTARGVFDPDDVDADGILEIEWRQAQQLTSGTRDSNKIWIASFYDPVADEGGFAITWQEDPDGLRPGKGEGPGEGYSGATTNHGADIWYTHITLKDFDDVCTDVDEDGVCTATTDDPLIIAGMSGTEEGKPKPAVNFTYPVRITNNEICTPDDFDVNDLANSNKPWCATNCEGTVTTISQNESGTPLERCYQKDVDYMTYNEPAAAVLDGDTGASRPTLNILVTNADPREYVAVLAYEETKGLSLSTTADMGETETDIALEGKAVYLETFFWDDPVTVSAGNLVNQLVPRGTVDDLGNVTVDEADLIYENTRRVVILGQVDSCDAQEADDFTFGLIYKQGYETQGGPSDMFIRVNTGFTHETFVQLDGRDVTNVSSHSNVNNPYDASVSADLDYVLWGEADLDSQSYTYPADNTFSPRGWLRGGEIYTGFEYSPLWRATTVGTVPNNFWMHRYDGNAWLGPVQLSLINNPEGLKVSTLDPRFIPTPKGSDSGLESDKSNPEVIFLGYGTFDMKPDGHGELDLYYMRSTDSGATWEYVDDGDPASLIVTGAGEDRLPGTDDDTVPGAHRAAKLAARAIPDHEMELQGTASPDGTMFYGAWLRETPGPIAPDGNIHQDGLESEFGRVDYNTEVVVPE
jgi:hypothetical protein